MKKYSNVIILFVTISNIVNAYNLKKQNSLNLQKLFDTKQAAHISPEIINELKDFKNLIPTATIDEIVAKHYLTDGNFRTALKYLRSQEFTQLQKQLLNVPEIIDVLEFLHVTTANATTSHMGATKMPTTAKVMASLDAYNADDVADSYNVLNKMTANTGTISSKPKTMVIGNEKESLNNLKVPKRPQQQFYNKEENSKVIGVDDDDDEATNANVIASNEREPLVRIVLLEDIVVKATFHNDRHHNHHHKYNRQCKNCYHHSTLGTFTSFVEEVLQHLPHSDYQNMIKAKCKRNPKFLEFYKALRSAQFKPLIEQVMTTNNIKQIIETLNSHDMDVNTLLPIAFQVISWGPDI